MGTACVRFRAVTSHARSRSERLQTVTVGEIIRASGGSPGRSPSGGPICALLAQTEACREPGGVSSRQQRCSRAVPLPTRRVGRFYITGNAYKGTVPRTALGPIVAADADEFRAAYAEALA